MVYVMAGPKKMIIEHTEVDESRKGQGIGEKLLGELVDYVRKEDIKVIPCVLSLRRCLRKKKNCEMCLFSTSDYPHPIAIG
ncbi:GNAT family N-acetyltransferase [Algoriphagus aquimarinus]|uniref:GNAT family N-acetyltransferase n=1 Tax=Algoriphagus aquimarinus TaxID=237018 RepID=UPI001CB9ACBF|nr:GNAT family N-acetyltransferase [Algoriphagus aquimarinus]